MAPVCRTVRFSRTNADAPTKEVLEAGYAGMTMTPSRSSDIYSFGKTLSILYSVSKDASNYNDKDEWWTNTMPNLIARCMDADPTKRPKARHARRELQRTGPGGLSATLRYAVVISGWFFTARLLCSPALYCSSGLMAIWNMIWSTTFLAYLGFTFLLNRLLTAIRGQNLIGLAQDSWFWTAFLVGHLYVDSLVMGPNTCRL